MALALSTLETIHFNSDDRPSKATRLRKVLTDLWEVRAQWRRLAGEIEQITEGECEVKLVSLTLLKGCFVLLKLIIIDINCNYLPQYT